MVRPTPARDGTFDAGRVVRANDADLAGAERASARALELASDLAGPVARGARCP
jgi:hypothetical protein